MKKIITAPHQILLFAVFTLAILIPNTQALAQTAFVSIWETAAADETITIPTVTTIAGYDYTIDCGTGGTEAVMNSVAPPVPTPPPATIPSPLPATSQEFQPLVRTMQQN